MRNSAAVLAQHDPDADLAGFTRELSELCRKHGLGLGGATVYEMQPEDYKFNYQVDDESKLVLG